MKDIYIIVALIGLSICLFSCTPESTDTINTYKDMPLSVTVTANAFTPAKETTTTRASENLYKTEFINGDQIGIIAIKDGKIVDEINNICFTYNASTKKWAAIDGSPLLYYYQDVTYIAYYPYDATTMAGKTSEQEIIDAFTPQADQSTYANYTASDLMVATGIANRTTKTLTLPFRHTMAMVSVSAFTSKFVTSSGYEYSPGEDFAVRNLAETAITVGTEEIKPYPTNDGTHRAIIRPDATAQTIKIQYKWVDLVKYTDNTARVLEAGKYHYYSFTMPESTPYVRPIYPGDYFYRDGKILPREALVIPDPTNCVGILIGAASGSDTNYGGNCENNTIHGHALSVYDVATCKWGPNGNIGTNTSDSWNDWRGYQLTQKMKEDADANYGGLSTSNYAAAYYCLNYGNTDRGKLIATQNSGWYFPSEGFMYSWAILQWGNINASLSKLVSSGYGQNIGGSSYYWDASTANNDGTARLVQLNPGRMGYVSARSNSRKVRAILTF